MAAAKSTAKVDPRRLAAFVHVGNQVFGPGDEVPAEVAALITNPAAWDPSPTAAEAPDHPSGVA